MIRREDVYRIGCIGKAHGIKGEVSVQVSDDVFDRVDAEYLVLELDGIMVPFFMEEYRFKTDETVLVKFEGVDTQERARELTGTEVYFPRELADEADDGELSYAQLVGYTLKDNADGIAVGVIAAVDEQTMNIMFELADGRLLPASEELIVSIDTEEKVITMIIPEGILDL
ncbi:MAG: ribosome maturation factor RimM [Prevotellaceae bacterium]|nr:ribosome maturation factor RimM [Prevotellaceae bacterium]MDO4931346.1 ribosome maturation factor RimM [Prevotellaceae bacterium]